MDSLWLPVAAGGALIVAAAIGYLIPKWRYSRQAAERQRGATAFQDRRSDLAELLLRAAGGTGKPRGLQWTGCELSGPPLFAVDQRSGELVALVGATVSFVAIEGGGMEEVEAVGNLRSATAVFVHRQGDWTADGRVIFNLEPAEALAKYRDALQPWEAAPPT